MTNNSGRAWWKQVLKDVVTAPSTWGGDKSFAGTMGTRRPKSASGRIAGWKYHSRCGGEGCNKDGCIEGMVRIRKS